MTSFGKGFKSTSAAAILGLSTITGVAIAPALAPAAVAQTASNIDVNKTGSITIHKRDGAEAVTRDDGNVNPNPGGTALPGVTFRVQQVNGVNLGTNEGLAAASKLTVESARAQGLQAGTTQVTGPDGTANFGNLPVGVYLVTEENAPEGYAPGAPFLVFIPMTNPGNTSQWNYDVNVYPKNSKVNAEKKVEDADQNVSDRVTFTISSDVPSPASDENISKYIVNDDLQENIVSTTQNDVTVALSDGSQTLTAGADYNVAVDPGTQKVTVTFTPDGLAKLTTAKKANASVKVETKIVATVKAVDDANQGHLVNDATVTSNRGGGSGDVTKNTNEVNTYWGKLKIVKTGDDNKPLNDAVFELYRCTDANTLGDKVTIGDQSNWTTANDGTVTINGLHVTDYENGAEISAAKKYCLVETKAPNGYELLSKPVEVNFTRADLANTNDGTDAITQAANIKNVPSNGPKLPLTGGAGIGLLALLGAALVGAGAFWAKRNSSKA